MNQKVFLMKIQKIFKFFCIFLIGAGFILSAQVSRAQDAGEKSIAVMPYVKGKNPESIEETITRPYSSFCFDNESIKQSADRTLTRMLQTMLNRDFRGRVVPLEQAVDAFEIIKVDHIKDTPKVVLLKLGETLNTDYMMAGNVWRYTDRVGASFSAEKPASVAFAVYLVDMKTGRLIWTESYDKTQQALTDNLFNAKDFFKQGAKWLTAEELARFGMNKMFENFPLKQ
ncbi:MAG: hypothetical protein HF978_17770 [Desulfobacteraceae bacterium]|nr:hypothetical protein [Desulfobacteraceae bacterium]MBC2757396.1 hypothetical protein [Desulfobacteraceae bacterium]